MTLKDELFNSEIVRMLGSIIKEFEPSFELDSFVSESVRNFDQMELKERMSEVGIVLSKHLSDDYPSNIALLEKVAKKIEPGHFVFGSVLDYVSVAGCNDEYYELALDALANMTEAFSSEFAIRVFINKYPLVTLQKFKEWSLSDNLHIRRFASEGIRPKLPWSIGITCDYKEGAVQLDNLYYDDVRYVTRSVANHLNDISKIDPMFVLETLKRWIKEGKQNEDEMKYIVNHSLRTLVKKGHKETLNFLGFKDNPNVQVTNLAFKKETIELNEYLEYSFDIEAKEDADIVIDYTLYFVSKTKTRNQKTFKLLVKKMKKGQKVTINKRKQFKHYSTRTLNPGTHTLCLQLNGKEVIRKDFELKI